VRHQPATLALEITLPEASWRFLWAFGSPGTTASWTSPLIFPVGSAL
jgi:hypothetical protein